MIYWMLYGLLAFQQLLPYTGIKTTTDREAAILLTRLYSSLKDCLHKNGVEMA